MGIHKHHHHQHHSKNVDYTASPPRISGNDTAENEKGKEQSSPKVAKAEDDWDDVKIGGEEGGRGGVGGEGEPSTTSGSSGSGSSVEDSSGEWFYIDKKGAQQGPFQSSVINDWTVAGYLPMNLKVKHGENSKIYKSLGEVWKDDGIDRTFFEEDEGEGTKRVEDIKIGDMLGPSPIRRRREDESF